MAIQLGLDGQSVKLLDGKESSLREVLALTADRYRGYTAAIDMGESDRSVYWRIIFSILSVHSPLNATFEAYKSLRLWQARFGRAPSVGTTERLLRMARGSDGVVQYQHSKSTYLREFMVGWNASRVPYVRGACSDDNWRLRIQQNVKGLGLAKASFAVALSAPTTSDVCCIDTHMHAIFTGKVARNAISKRLYLELEQRVRTLGKEYGLSTFQTQWCLWDSWRGVCNPHAALAAL